MFGASLVLLPGLGEEEVTLKAVNLPAWKTVGIDMEEVVSGHTAQGERAIQSALSGRGKDLFPIGMSTEQIEAAIRQAYRRSTRIGGTAGGRAFLEGKAFGLRIQMYLNIAEQIIESAWPKW
jgi:hypothetical protein